MSRDDTGITQCLLIAQNESLAEKLLDSEEPSISRALRTRGTSLLSFLFSSLNVFVIFVILCYLVAIKCCRHNHSRTQNASRGHDIPFPRVKAPSLVR